MCAALRSVPARLGRKGYLLLCTAKGPQIPRMVLHSWFQIAWKIHCVLFLLADALSMLRNSKWKFKGQQSAYDVGCIYRLSSRDAVAQIASVFEDMLAVVLWFAQRT